MPGHQMNRQCGPERWNSPLGLPVAHEGSETNRAGHLRWSETMLGGAARMNRHMMLEGREREVWISRVQLHLREDIRPPALLL